jgi:VWFA-related protein
MASKDVMKASAVVIVAAALFPLALAVPSLARAQAPPSPAPPATASPAPAPEASPAAQAPPADAQSPTFPAQVEQVTVDVVVTDKKGTPITGLGREDFTLAEDGDAQSIASFEAVQVPAAAAAVPAARPRVSTNTAPEAHTGRTFVIVFDDIHLTPGQARRAKVAVTEFLTRGVREGDRVTLVASGGGAWWSTRMEAGREELITLLKRLDGRYIPDTSPERMTDYEAMRINIYHDPQVIARVARRYDAYGVNLSGRSNNSPDAAGIDPDPYISSRATDVYYQATAKNRITLEVMERVLDSLGGTKGRKSVILVSQGFIYDPNMDEFKKVVQASRRSNAAIYFLDTRGLEGMPMALTAEFGPMIDEQDIGAAFSESIEASEGSESLASDSGGFSVKNTNDLSTGIKRIADESQAYYLLGYNPTNTRRDGRFRKIQVKVPAGKGYQIRARKGYYAPLEGRNALAPKPGAVDPVIQSALDSPYDVAQIPLRMTAYVFDETILGKANVVIVVDTDVRDFAFHEEGGRFLDTLEFLLVAAHRESGEYYRYDQSVEMKLLPATHAKIVSYPMSRDFELAPGGYQAKIVVRDKNSGRIGTLVHEFEVPALGPFRISTPILSDTMQPAPASTGEKTNPQPMLLARREFPAGAMLLAQYEVYGAAKEKGSGMPRVTAGYQIRRRDGTVVTHVDTTPIQPTSLGRLMRLVGTRLVDFEPGDYEIVLSLKDEVAGKSLEVREPFSVTPAPAPAPAPASGG